MNDDPPDQAEAILLRTVLGLDAATAGHVLGKGAGAIRTAAHRGLKTLRKNWGPTSPSSQIATSIATS